MRDHDEWLSPARVQKPAYNPAPAGHSTLQIIFDRSALRIVFDRSALRIVFE